MNSHENSACGHQPQKRSRPRKAPQLQSSNASHGLTMVPASDPSWVQLSRPLAHQDSQNTHAGSSGKRPARSTNRPRSACVVQRETQKSLKEAEKAMSSDPSKSLAFVSAVSPQRTRRLTVDGGSSPSLRQLLAQDSQVPSSSNSLALEDGSVRLSQLLAEDSTPCWMPAAGTHQKKNSGQLDCARFAPQHENPKKGRRSGRLAIKSAAAYAAGNTGTPVNDRLSQRNSNPVGGPPRFTQLLAQDSEGSNPQNALNPDTPSQTFHDHVPAAIRELFKQKSPEAPAPSKTSRTVASEPAEPTCPEDNVRAKIIDCLLDPNFQDLLSEVEKVWGELEVSMSDESQLAQAVMRRLKAASSSAGPSNGK